MSIHKKDSGFTFIEILAALSILSIIGASLWSAISYTSTFYLKVDKQAYINRQVLKIDSALRKNISKVKFPFWLLDKEMELSNDYLKIDYFEGVKDNFLEISYSEEDGLLINETEKYTGIKELIINENNSDYPNCIVFELAFDNDYKTKIAVRLFSDILEEL